MADDPLLLFHGCRTLSSIKNGSLRSGGQRVWPPTAEERMAAQRWEGAFGSPSLGSVFDFKSQSLI